MTTIAFIGRKQNSSSWHKRKFISDNAIEVPRVKEIEGLAQSNLIPIQDISQADIVYIRLNPERANKKHLKNILAAEKKIKPNALVLNSVSHFTNYASKVNTFSLWAKSNIDCPAFQVWSPWLSKNKQIKSVKELIKQHNGLYLRTHNEDSGKGIVFLPPSATTNEITKAILTLRLRALSNKVNQSQILAVAPVDNKDASGIYHVYRAHIACNKILGGYALVGTQKVIHASDQRIAYWEAFCDYNAKLQNILSNPIYHNQILQGFTTLKANIGAIEFFEVGGKLIFLEMNPQWGGTHRYGDTAFMSKLRQNINEPSLSHVKDWLEPDKYYCNLYNHLATATVSNKNEDCNA
ncbi:hypothetical protein [Reinekea sp.]|jgi:hypothetical protein|uniref:hypothetical protein n=1 Tax=Reinekea sp. TaxID=1970455 RepID=UPI0039891C55